MLKHQFDLRKIVIFAISIFCLSITFVQQSKAELSANLPGNSLKLLGIGMHQELRNDIYIGALFAPETVTDVEQLKNDTVAKRMSIRFVSKYSHRKMARHWKERLAMNNPRNRWQPLTREIVGFSRIFKRSLEIGDELNIDHVPGVGTQVYLNGTLFQTINKEGFVDLLLNVWLGTNPPTKAFKKSIRGQDTQPVQQDFVTKYEALQPIPGRFDQDLQPVTKVAAVETPAKKTTVVKKTPAKKNTTPAKKPPAKKVAKTTPPPKKKPEQNQKKVSTPSKAVANNKKTETKPSSNADPAKKLATDASKVAKLDKDNFKPDIKLDSAIAKEIAKPPVQKTASLEKPSNTTTTTEDLEEEFFDADLISGSYTRDLLNSIRQFQQYPKKALVNGDQGDVLARVKIDSNGEIIDFSIVERSGSRILDKAVTRMVRKAAPFQAIPKELKLQEFEFEVPISFQL
ncbi:TonB family protein [Aliikangiella coralliicola]|uniref:TonB family protein n=1 Tax=Aliikangiella coralliicola TaxID=2592383 RepID=A0A545U0H5_9GAMM|nr:TonB family protein [Aliikangiella coralliicola]TQV82959.1 TonB family protein [Aliikangiella coralliicola]